MKDKQAWSGDIACEGGPVMVANLADFIQWHGAEPLPPSQATELHFWSPFTGELPEAWQPNGPSGHQYLASADPLTHCEALMDWIAARWPGTSVERGPDRWCAIRPDGKRLQAVLSPGSDYDRAIRDLGHEGIHRFAQGAHAYLWSAAPGLVRVSVAASRDLLLLSQVEYADSEGDAAEAHGHAARMPASPGEGGLRYRIDGGPVVVAWSPNSAGDAVEPLADIAAAPARSDVLLDFAIAGSGAMVWLEAGTYASSLHYHEQDRWAISWCRLERIRDGQAGDQ